MKRMLSVALLLIAAMAFSQVDFVNRKVSATGYGNPNPNDKMAIKRFGAVRAAEMDAIRKILEEIKGTLMTSNSTVNDLMLESDVTTAQVEGIAKFYEVVGEPVYKDDMSVELTIELSLSDLDWRNKVVQVTGIGTGKSRPLSLRAAELDAKRKILERTKGIYLTAATITKSGELQSDKINSMAEGIVRNSHIVKGSDKYFDDGSVEVICEVKLDENLQSVPGFSSILMKNVDFEEDYPIVAEATYKLSDIVPAPEVYTGLIIDCKGVDLRPALAPKVYNASGKEVYGSSMVSQSFATQQGMMGYDKNIDKAKGNARIGGNPLIIKATGVQGANKADIVISDSDATKIESAAKQLKFLGECRVMAIIK